MDKLFSKEAFVHAVAGTFGGSVTMTTFYPLDQIRTFIQVDERFKKKSMHRVAMELVKEEGIESMYQGLAPTLMSLACSNFIFFYTNNFLKIVYKKFTQTNDIPVYTNLAIASVAGAINVLTTCPFWVVNTRLKVQKNKAGSGQTQKYNGMFDGLYKVATEEGLGELWSGCAASLILVSNPTIQFVTYDFIKKSVTNWRQGRGMGTALSALELFLLGAVAKAIATVITYPLQLAQSKLRHGGHHASKAQEYHSTITFLLHILKKDGFMGWFNGLNAKLLQTILMAAFHFLCYEKIAGLIFTLTSVKQKHGGGDG